MRIMQYLVSYLFVSITFILITYITNIYSEHVFFILGISCMTELITFIWANTKIHKRALNYASLFIVVLFIFHFGQVILLAFLSNNVAYVRLGLLFNSNESFIALRPINISFAIICLGILIGEYVPIKKNNNIHKARQRNDEYWQKISKIILWLTLPVKIAVDFIYLKKSMLQGFVIAKEWLNSFPNFIISYGNFSLIGLVMLMLCLKNNIKKQNIVFMFSILYLSIIMLSGIRSENVAYLCVFALLYLITKEKRINIFKLIILGFSSIFLLVFLISVAEFRNVSTKNIYTFIETLGLALKNKNIIFATLEEYGNTGYTAISVIKFWIGRYPLGYGKSYILGLSAIIPNIFGIAGKLTRDSTFALKLQDFGALASGYTNIGGSIIGEIFFNFGVYGGVIVSLFLGILIGTISKNVDYFIRNRRYERLIYFIPIMFGTLYWIRDYFGGRIREVVWGALFCYLIIQVVKMKESVITQKKY